MANIMKLFTAKVYDLKTDELVLEEQYLTSSSISVTSSSNQIKNGKDNDIWSTFYSGKECNVELQSNVQSIERMMIMSGVPVDPDATSFQIRADKFPVAYRLVLETDMINAEGVVEKCVRITMKAKPSADFTIAASSDFTSGNDVTINFTAMAVNGVLADVEFLDVEEDGSAAEKKIYYGLLKQADTASVDDFADITEAMIDKAVTAGNVHVITRNLNKISLGVAAAGDIHVIAVPVGRKATKFNGISEQVKFSEALLGSANGEAIQIDGESYLLFGEKSVGDDTELFGYTA